MWTMPGFPVAAKVGTASNDNVAGCNSDRVAVEIAGVESQERATLSARTCHRRD